MINFFQQAGAQPQKQTKYAPLFIDKTFTGFNSNRAALHDPSDLATSHFYGGRPDALWAGSNVELTVRNTIARRPGLSELSSTTYPTVPLRAYPFEIGNGTIQLIIDTGSAGSLSVTSVANASAGTSVYTGVFPQGVSNAYVGWYFQISGFSVNPINNGTFICKSSTATTLTLANTGGVFETHAASAVSAGAVYYDQQNGSKTLLFGKAVGAGQTYFSGVAGVLYMGDGVETKKYTPLNTNGLIWNWGIAAPTVQPKITVVESGSAAAIWTASTVYLTIGIVVDPNGFLQFLVSTNTGTTFGTSSAGGPTWNQVENGTTSDGTVVWRNIGLLSYWNPHTLYNDQSNPIGLPTCIYDPSTGAVYAQFSGSSGTSGANKPAFPPIIGYVVQGDGSCKWICLGTSAPEPGFPGSTAPYGFKWPGSSVALTAPPSGAVHVIEPNVPPVSGPLPVSNNILVNNWVQLNQNTGTTTSSPSALSWNDGIGQPTTDNQLTWSCIGPKTWAAGTAYTAWTSPNSGGGFSAVVDTNGSLQVCTTGGISGASDPFAVIYWGANTLYFAGASASLVVDTNNNRQQCITGGTSQNPGPPAWNTTVGGNTTDGTVVWKNLGSAYGLQTTNDGSVTWFNCGKAISWAASTQYYVPTSGFTPPSLFDPLAGPDINDGTNIEFLVQSGKSGASVPSWSVTTGNFTNDNTAVWKNNGPFVQSQLKWTTGHNYAYSWKARSLTDYYSVPSIVSAPGQAATIPVPPGLTQPLPAPSGSETGAISTSSPVFTITGANAGAVVTITAPGPTDPQVDTVVIYRDADGGGSSEMFELTEIPVSLNQSWTFQDTLPDTASSTEPGLNTAEPAPIDHQNDPPQSSYLPMVYNFQRIWGAYGQQVNFSGGPDTATGNPNEAFNPSDELPFLAPVTAVVKNSQGLVTFLTNSVELIAGGPVTSSFFSVTLAPGLGLLNYNFLDVFAGEIYFYAGNFQFYTINPSLNLSMVGYPIADQLANLPSSGVSDTIWNPNIGYVAVHNSAMDNCVFIADGSTGWYRMNPHQVPGGASGPEPIWSPFALITNGAQMVQSVETTPGIKKLLVGSTQPGGKILYRDLTKFTDDGTQYDAYFVMGSIMLVHPGQLALLKFLEADFSGRIFQPTVSYLLNEISGSFVPFIMQPVFDPPSLYGNTLIPNSYSPNRYYFSGNASLARCRHLQIKVDFGLTSNQDEIYNLTIFGRMFQEL